MDQKRIQSSPLTCQLRLTPLISWNDIKKKNIDLCNIMTYLVERSDRAWSTGEGNAKPLQYSCLENPLNSMKRQKCTLKDEHPR